MTSGRLVTSCSVVLLSTLVSAQQSDVAYLKAKVNPGSAGVFVDGKYVGPAASLKVTRKYVVTPGIHEIRFVDPRYEEVTTSVAFQTGKTTILTQTLTPLPSAGNGPFGTMRIECPDKYAAVYVNDKFYGHAGEFNSTLQGILLPPGEYTVRIEPVSGENRVKKTVKVEENKTVVVM